MIIFVYGYVDIHIDVHVYDTIDTIFNILDVYVCMNTYIYVIDESWL